MKGDLARFRSVWEESVAEAAAQSLRLVAVSFPDLGINTGLTITAMDVIMTGVDDGAAVKEGGYSVGDRGETVDDQAAHRPLNVWQVSRLACVLLYRLRLSSDGAARLDNLCRGSTSATLPNARPSACSAQRYRGVRAEGGVEMGFYCQPLLGAALLVLRVGSVFCRDVQPLVRIFCDMVFYPELHLISSLFIRSRKCSERTRRAVIRHTHITLYQ